MTTITYSNGAPGQPKEGSAPTAEAGSSDARSDGDGAGGPPPATPPPAPPPPPAAASGALEGDLIIDFGDESPPHTATAPPPTDGAETLVGGDDLVLIN
mmetsp:Transcript_11285/g.29820  ORF Transcript_11285/g.29820 Transcript_11285/m.29820 type:complete len:99 (+) Transcript_11285:953-1249(+)